MDVVQPIVAVLDLQRLADTRADHARPVDAAALIDDDRFGRHRRLRKRPLEVDEHVGQTAVEGRGHEFLHHALAAVRLRRTSDPCPS